jgi:peroxiredoxin
MKRSVGVIICLLSAIFMTGSSQCWGFRNLKEGEPAPDFKLKDLDGKTYSLSKAKGKVTVILYWRPGQERSLNALKALKGISEELSDQPLQILAITKDADKLSKIKSLKESLQIPYPILLDREAEVYAKFGVFVFPATALIDKKGIYRFHHGGFRDNYYEEISGLVRILLGLITKEEWMKKPYKI